MNNMYEIGKNYWIWGGLLGLVIGLVFMITTTSICAVISQGSLVPFCIVLYPLYIPLVVLYPLVEYAPASVQIFVYVFDGIIFALVGSLIGWFYGKIVNKKYGGK